MPLCSRSPAYDILIYLAVRFVKRDSDLVSNPWSFLEPFATHYFIALTNGCLELQPRDARNDFGGVDHLMEIVSGDVLSFDVNKPLAILLQTSAGTVFTNVLQFTKNLSKKRFLPPKGHINQHCQLSRLIYTPLKPCSDQVCWPARGFFLKHTSKPTNDIFTKEQSLWLEEQIGRKGRSTQQLVWWHPQFNAASTSWNNPYTWIVRLVKSITPWVVRLTSTDSQYFPPNPTERTESQSKTHQPFCSWQNMYCTPPQGQTDT